MAIGDTLVLASSSHTRTKATGSSQLSQAFVSLKKKNFAQTVLLTRAFFHFALRSLILTRSNINPTHRSRKATKSRQDFYNPKKRGEEKDNTHRLTQYMTQSEAVFLDDKAFTHGRRGIDTEIGRTLLPMRRFLPGNWERVDELQKKLS